MQTEAEDIGEELPSTLVMAKVDPSPGTSHGMPKTSFPRSISSYTIILKQIWPRLLGT